MNLGWDGRFSPFDGAFDTDRQWYLEVGDAKYVRIVTDANPSRESLQDESGWVNMTNRKVQKDAQPIVVVRIDLSRLAGQLQDLS